eukprot:268389-Rhodomonas_salina.1
MRMRVAPPYRPTRCPSVSRASDEGPWNALLHVAAPLSPWHPYPLVPPSCEASAVSSYASTVSSYAHALSPYRPSHSRRYSSAGLRQGHTLSNTLDSATDIEGRTD